MANGHPVPVQACDSRVLVLNVDDNDAARFVKSAYMRRCGYDVLEAVCGTDALVAVRERPVDVVLLDVKLPDVDGFEVCRRIKSDPALQAIQVLQISATYTDDAARARGLTHGADAYLVSPVSELVLGATVAALHRARRAEIQLRGALARERAALEASERANLLKDEFLAIVSHELRTPLNAIAGWVWQLRRPELDGVGRERALAGLERSAQMQARIVDDLLDVARIVKGQLRCANDVVELGHVVRAAMESVEAAAAAKRIAMTTDLEPVQVRGDADRLQQVVWNLLTNAVRFTPAEGRIAITLRRVDTAAQLSVRDTGAGIAREFLPFVFDRFSQADSTYSRPHGGLGLGLAIVRHITELHGGTATVASDGPGTGATFVISIPALADEGPAPAKNVRGEAPLRGCSVLVVEDDPDALEITMEMLRSAGAEVDGSPTAGAAIASTRARRFDVLLVDIGLPGESGLSLIRHLRHAGNDAKAIAVTGYDTQAALDASAEAGFALHLVKPVSPERLVQAILDVLRQSAR